MNRNDIYIIEGHDTIDSERITDMTRRLLAECGLADLIQDRSLRIALKPNLVSPSHPSMGATTHPEILAGIITYLRENGFKNIVMMEGSWVGSPTAESFEAAGYGFLTEEYHVPFTDTQKEKSVSIDCAGIPIRICKCALDIDFLINVPVVKGHCQTRITCALKNLKGLLPNAEKRRFHSLGLHKPIAHLNAFIRQGFIVADNICGDLDFEDGGNPVPMNRILAGLDPVLMDSYVCSMMGYTPEDVPYVKLAEQLGVGNACLSDANLHVIGDQAVPCTVHSHHRVVELEDAVEEVDSCSACYGYLLPALDNILSEIGTEGNKAEVLERLLGGRICIGQGWRGKKGRLGIGNCTKEFDLFLEGCPPTENQIEQFLRKVMASGSVS